MIAPAEQLTNIRPKLRAWNNFVAIELTPTDDQLFAGLVIPHANGRAMVTGTVLSVGPDGREDIHPGDIALVPPYGVGHRLEMGIPRRPYIFILDYDILGVWPHASNDKS